MKNTLTILSLALMSVLLIGCDDDKDGKMNYAEWCARNPSCAASKAVPQNVAALAGAAAVGGNPQVAAAIAQKNTQQGQVPNVVVLPASIQEQAKKITATMQAMNEDPDFALNNGTNTLVSANYVSTVASGGGGGSAGEITVASVPEAREPAQQQMAPASAAPAQDLNSVFAQPEAGGSQAAH